MGDSDVQSKQESEYGDARYETRIVAYADILGCKDATTDAKKSENLYKAVTSIAKHAGSFSPSRKEVMAVHKSSFANYEKYASVEFSFFSDNFAISTPVDSGNLVFSILAWATDKILHQGFLVRGGVALGELYHSRGVIFGPALVRAVEIEQCEALYPRFLCSHKLLRILESGVVSR